MFKVASFLSTIVLSSQLCASHFVEPEFHSEIRDHKFFSHTVDDFDGLQITIGTVNCWARGTRSGFMGLSDYQSPNKDPYANWRVKRNISDIHHFLDHHQNPFVGVQEWSSDDLDQLLAAVGTKYVMDLGPSLPPISFDTYDVTSSPTLGETFCHGSICNSTTWNRLSFSTDDLLPLNNLNWQAGGKTGNQQGRYQHTKYKHKDTGKIFEVVNLHFKWASTPAAITTALQNLFPSTSNVIIMGDFNADLNNCSIPGYHLLPSVNGSLVHNTTTGQADLKTNDAILYHISSSYNPTPDVSYHLGNPGPFFFTLIKGFSSPEGTHRWTEGRDATLKVPVLHNGHQIKSVAFRNTVGLISAAKTQLLYVFLNGRKTGCYRYELSSPIHAIVVPFPSTLVGDAEITFSMPFACQPVEVDPTNHDPRELAVFFKEVEVTYY